MTDLKVGKRDFFSQAPDNSNHPESINILSISEIEAGFAPPPNNLEFVPEGTALKDAVFSYFELLDNKPITEISNEDADRYILLSKKLLALLEEGVTCEEILQRMNEPEVNAMLHGVKNVIRWAARHPTLELQRRDTVVKNLYPMVLKAFHSQKISTYVFGEGLDYNPVPQGYWTTQEARNFLKSKDNYIKNSKYLGIDKEFAIVASEIDIGRYLEGELKSIARMRTIFDAVEHVGGLEISSAHDARADAIKDIGSQETIEPVNKGGRPSIYSSEWFLIEAAAVILEGFPESQKALIERTLDAYEKAGHVGGRPSLDWARAKIRPLWHRLNSERGV